MLKLLLRWKVLRQVTKLMQTVGNAYEDGHLSDAERGAVMKEFWVLVRMFKGK